MRRLTAILLLPALCLLCGCGTPAPAAAPGGAGQTTAAADINGLSRVISRYVELSGKDFDRGTASREELIELVYGYMTLHESGSITRKPLDAGGTMYGAVSLEELNRCARLLFGESFEESRMQDYIVARYSGDVVYSMYLKGEVYFLEGPARRANGAAVAVGAEKLPDGNLLAAFDTYSVPAESNAGTMKTGSGSAVLIPAPGTEEGYFISSVVFDKEQQTGVSK